MSLPLAFKTAHETIPADTPYLRAEPERIEKWKQRLGNDGFKVGINWHGRKGLNRGRSFALRELYGIESLGEEYDAGADAFLDAAAVTENLDLIISSDTAIAHLAGALGRPVWVALKHVPDWRWMLDRSDSPWYPTMRLFRQRTEGDWKEVFSDIANELVALICCKQKITGGEAL
jgi:hypothetical protein